MSIKYNIIQRVEPGVAGGGNRKYHPVANKRSTINIDMLTDEIAALSTVNGADVSAVLYGLLEIITKFLDQGNSIELGSLGYLRVSFNSEGSETEEEVSPANITRRRVLFQPGKKLKKMLNNLEFSKE